MSEGKHSTEGDDAASVESMLRRLAEEFGPDSKLPSVRELARQLGVSGAEMGTAIEALERGELIYRRPRAGIFVSEKILRKNYHIVLDHEMVQNPGASPLWGQIWSSLLTQAEERSTTGESFTFHMSNSVSMPGPIRDLFYSELERGSVHAVLGVGLKYQLVHSINRYRVPVVGYAGAGNHVVASTMDDQVAAVTDQLAQAGCKRIEFWSRANTGNPAIGFSVYDILDPIGLIARFKNANDRPAQHIFGTATAETARHIAAFGNGETPSFDLRRRLLDILNAVQYQGWLWDESVFAGVKLRDETVSAITSRTDGDVALMTANRMIIQDTFPNELTQTPTSETDSINAFRAAMRTHFPDQEPATVRRAGRADSTGDVGHQLPGYNLARSLYGTQGATKPDGLVIEDDMIASGVHKALEELGVKVGEDVKIATHANAGSAVGFALHGRVIQMLFDPSDFVNAMFTLLDQDAVNDLDHMTIARVEARIVSPRR